MPTDLLRKPQPTHEEFIFLIIITAIFTGLLVVTDITIHDTYIKTLVAQCYPTNHETICTTIRQIQGLPSDAHLSIGQAYWGILLLQVVVVAGIIGLLRIMFTKLAGAKITPMVLFTGFLWFGTSASFYFFGWLDWAYYTVRGLEIPQQLPWLDGVGLFQFVQNFGDTSSVDKSDLTILMVAGVFLILGLWTFITHHYRTKTLHKLGIK